MTKSQSLILVSVLAAAGPMIAADPGAGERRVPPPGLPIADEERRELEAGVALLGQEIQSLRETVKDKPALIELLPDVQIFHKAVDWALRDDGFYRSNEVGMARGLLGQGRERAARLRGGEAPWASATGLVVRGYISRIDGSVQPYGLIVPGAYSSDRARPRRLDVWLHGRDDHLTELKFISDRQRSAGEFAPGDAFVLHPYGRYCNAFKFAGETDVWEALAHVKRHYPVDENRVALRGFSMGGAGCWHLGAHHASEFVVVAPGAGFADTAGYLGLARGPGGPPVYERKLWRLYDARDYALNLFNTTPIAYSGELDKQKAAADAMAAAMRSQGMELIHLIGPKTEHRYEPEAKKELARRVDDRVAQGRDPLPKKVRMTTATLRFNEMFWVTVEALRRHWEPARVEAEIVSPHEIGVRAEGATGLTLGMPAGLCPLERALRPEIRVNGQRLDAPRVQGDGSWKVHLMEESGRWSVVHSFDDGVARKRHGLQGPIDDAFMEAFVMVTPTGKAQHEEIAEWTVREMGRAMLEWRSQFRGEARTIPDDRVSESDLASSNLVLWGDPHSNKVLARIADRLPILWDAKTVRVGEKSYDSRHHLPVLIWPNPLNPARYVVLNSGFTFAHPRSTSNADQTPKLPDYAVVDIEGPPAVGVAGEVVEAGFFDEQWRLPEKGK